mmetsp:Transcript_36712/g.77037  ORF Transcript_36712/g.77037 Transcript_36712/m.77037 type:complete len:161 (-) Transcript_36712:659-1141(-)
MNLQQHWMDITDYHKKFVDMKTLVDKMTGEDEGTYNRGGIINIVCREKGLNCKSSNNDQEVEFMMSRQERMLAIHFIINSDWERYGDVIEQFNQAYLSGNNNYPKKLHDAYTLLKNWTKRPQKKHVPSKLGLSFNIKGDKDGNTLVLSHPVQDAAAQITP